MTGVCVHCWSLSSDLYWTCPKTGRRSDTCLCRDCYEAGCARAAVDRNQLGEFWRTQQGQLNEIMRRVRGRC